LRHTERRFALLVEDLADGLAFRDTTRPDARERRSMEFRAIAYFSAG
jgi:hypothetical protein